MTMKKGKCSSSSMAKALIADKKEPVTLFENMILKIIDGVHGENLSMKQLCAPEHNIVLIIMALCMLQDDILHI